MVDMVVEHVKRSGKDFEKFEIMSCWTTRPTRSEGKPIVLRPLYYSGHFILCIYNRENRQLQVYDNVPTHHEEERRQQLVKNFPQAKSTTAE